MLNERIWPEGEGACPWHPPGIHTLRTKGKHRVLFHHVTDGDSGVDSNGPSGADPSGIPDADPGGIPEEDDEQSVEVKMRYKCYILPPILYPDGELHCRHDISLDR